MILNTINKAVRIYSEEGMVQLWKRARARVRRSLYYLKLGYKAKVDNLRRHLPGGYKTINLNGVEVEIKTHYIDELIPLYQPPYPTRDKPDYEHTEVESIRRYATAGDDVVVIGGGLGVTAVVASQTTNGSVTVFEESADAYEILTKTVELNGCSDTINARHAAVGEVGLSYLTHSTVSDIDSKVETTPAEELPDADVYEMDCEGAETEILKRMKVRPTTLLVETHNNHNQVMEIIDERGYEVVEIVDDGVGQSTHCTHIRAQLP